MIQTMGYAVHSSKDLLGPYSFERRDPKEKDVVIDILFCGICHSDIHQVRNEWGGSLYPMVPGHEIVGRVSKVGSQVSGFAVGDVVGVGCMVDSCRQCRSCQEGLQQYCEEDFVGTYNGLERDTGKFTMGGYASVIVVDEAFVLKIPPHLDLARVAPLLCAGITTYSPLRHGKVGPGQKVGVIGLGGLGHMGVKIACAMGAEVTVFTTSPEKCQDARRLGAQNTVLSTDTEAMNSQQSRFDFLLNTVAAPHDLHGYLALLRRDGAMIMVGIPDQPYPLSPLGLILYRKQLGGSLIGGIPETQEMLDFCAEHGVLSDIEIIPIQKINEAYERILAGDVKYRFVVDMQSLKA